MYLEIMMSFGRNYSINLDISNKCTLKCKSCERSEDHWKELRKVTGDTSFEDFKKIADYFEIINFCGQVSDPIFNKDLAEMLRYCYENGFACEVHTSANHKSTDWYIELFGSNPDCTWVFGLDGLPDSSPKYRINQNGRDVFNAMILARSMGLRCIWQYIVFSYNEEEMHEVENICNTMGVEFMPILSNRFDENDKLKPRVGLYVAKTKDDVHTGSLTPKCFRGRELGHSAMGYILPCCWMAEGNVEEKYPDLCNEKTKISNIDSIEEIFNSGGFSEYERILKEEPEKAYSICWKKCSTKSTPHKIYIRDIT
jgi:MoaA/NifB/PqqE/SkfB family radical SAM enzyme